MLGLFQRLTYSRLVPHQAARRELQKEISRGQTAQGELRDAYNSLEKRIAEHAEKLGRANEELSREMERSKRAEARFGAISESVAYGAWIYRLDGTADLVSASYQEMLGASPDKLRKTPWYEFIHPDDQVRVRSLWKEVTAKQAEWNCEFRVTGQDGQVRYIVSRGAPLSEFDEPAKHYAGVQLDESERMVLREELLRAKADLEMQVAKKTEELREANRHLVLDLAERMKAELALRDSESQLRAIYENAMDSMIVLGDDRRVLDANEAAQQLFGVSLEAIAKLRWDDLMPAERRAGLDERWANFLRGGTKKGEMEVRRSDGISRLVVFSSRSNIMPGRHLFTLRDVTEQREAEDSLRQLSRRLVLLQDEERRRIARELHDSTGQELVALRMHLDAMRKAMPKLPEKAQAALDKATATCQTCTAEIRTISYLLHPPLLDEVGLMPALEWYVAGLRERTGMHIEEEIAEPGDGLSRDLNTALFRIIQEALTNIHKHSESKQARIRLAAENGQLILEVSDNGKGFDPERMRERSAGVAGLGVGITGMRERVRQLGGTLEISAANPGTLVRATFPIKEASDGSTQSFSSG